MNNLPATYEICEKSNYLIYKPEYTVENLRAIFEKHSLEALLIGRNSLSNDITAVEYLRECSFVKKLVVNSLELKDLSFLLYMSQLIDLTHIYSSADLLDVSALVNLKRFHLQHPKKKLLGLENCIALEKVQIWQHRQKDMTSFANAVNMKVMDLRVSSIRSLAGIERWEHIENLHLAHCKALKDISQLRGKASLKHLELYSCNAIEDFEVLGELPNLEILTLTNLKRLPSISFIRKLPKLRYLSLLGNTHVLDGDLTPAAEVESAKVVHRKYYNVEVLSPKEKEVIALMEKHGVKTKTELAKILYPQYFAPPKIATDPLPRRKLKQQ